MPVAICLAVEVVGIANVVSEGTACWLEGFQCYYNRLDGFTTAIYVPTYQLIGRFPSHDLR